MNTELERNDLEVLAQTEVEKEYRSPQLRQVGDVHAVQGLYTGYYYDGPNSYYWYD